MVHPPQHHGLPPEKCSNWRAQPHPQDVYTPHSPDGNSPRKIYNNLVICGPDRQEEDGIGFEHSPQGSGGGNNRLNGAANTHQVFNNIILLTFLEGTKRYDPVVTNPNAQYSDNLRNRSDFLGNRQNRYSAAHSNELQDYNLYWRRPAMNVNAAFRNQRGAGQTVTTYADLAAWYASSRVRALQAERTATAGLCARLGRQLDDDQAHDGHDRQLPCGAFHRLPAGGHKRGHGRIRAVA